MRNLSVIFSSHLDDEHDQKFIQHLKDTAGVQIHVERVVNKGEFSLTEAYNKGWSKLDDLGRGKDIILFCHNDITIKTKNWGKIIVNLFNHFPDYDILGIAGSKNLLKHGIWYLDDKGQVYTPGTHMFGKVWHTNGLRQWESVFSEKITGVQPVVIADGLFLAVNGETILKRFNETFKGFHYYDVSFCFDNYLEGCNIGVMDKITVLHQSVGMTNAEWEKNRIQFVEQYKEELPVSV